jgi:curved DNA-binding protein CbpA
MMLADNADQEIITAVHRKLAKRYHPDIDPSPSAARRMSEINEAYQVLSNPGRRAAYDKELARRRDRRATDQVARQADEMPSSGTRVPLGPPSGSIINIGRYSGWSLGQIRRHDPAFLEWLMSAPAGRQYRDEIQGLLRST